MDRSEFLSLPAALQLRILFDALDEDAARFIAEMEKPKAPLPPKFDQAIYRSGGLMWASEVDLSGLLFWHKRYAADVEKGGEFQAQNRKRAESLARWVAWRECYPDAIWSGERNRVAVTAKPPSSKPVVYARQDGGSRPAPPPQDDDIDLDSSIPF